MTANQTTYIARKGQDAEIANLKVTTLEVNGVSVVTALLLAPGQVADLNGEADALVLDADADTTLSAPTDDQIDVEIAGADDFRFLANIFRALSGSQIQTDTLNETTATAGVTVDGALIKDGTVPTREVVTVASGDGAISAKDGIVIITKATAAALTLADPTAGDDDGKVLKIISATAAAHVVDNAAGSGFNAGGASLDTATFGGAKGDGLELLAYNGDWYVLANTNVTIGAGS